MHKKCEHAVAFPNLTLSVTDVTILIPLYQTAFGNVTAKSGNQRYLGW